ncbi:MAG: magnesium chelatase [Planctomycetes bacterium]|nr:magnesium chelatase [Planctomycetota bacterium]
MTQPKTIGELRRAGYETRSVRDEMRHNLLRMLREKTPRWSGIVGYDATVLPNIENAILAKQDFILLGLRGQAKTRILRQLIQFLDETIPALDGAALNDDPFAPVSAEGRRIVAEKGDDAPICWIPREQRYREKLATPDVTIADLIGDIDPIKAAARGLSYADEGAIHYGIIPRTNRGIFAINELPDLQPRIQVGLLNILEERDFQIRGFPIRLPLDIMMVFAANPEDYTNRGNIITPLRDRIAAQILTHYPKTVDEGMLITAQEAWTDRGPSPKINIPSFLRETVERVAFEARASEFVNQSSGVSARLTIALLEQIVSNAERRAARLGLATETARVCDLLASAPAVSGKVELVYEGEREGVEVVANRLIGLGLKATFDQFFPDALRSKPTKKQAHGADAPPAGDGSVFKPVQDWFGAGNTIVIDDNQDSVSLQKMLVKIPGLERLTKEYLTKLRDDESAAAMEFVLEGLHQNSVLARTLLDGSLTYGDMVRSMLEGMEFKKPRKS